MGDPRRLTKKFAKPRHPWQAGRISEEKGLVNAYGLKNRTEIWKIKSALNRMHQQAKALTASRSVQAQKEAKQFMDRLVRLGLLHADGKIGDILSVNTRDLLERRLQTQVVRKGLAKTMEQARQFIAHGHIVIGDKMITKPSYWVMTLDESKMAFLAKSSLANADHPARAVKPKQGKVEKKDEEGKKVESEKKAEPKVEVEKKAKVEKKADSGKKDEVVEKKEVKNES